MSQTFAFDSFLGGLNLLKKRDQRILLDQGERPPYPIINSQATFVDVLDNMNKSDAGILFAFTAVGKQDRR